MTAPVLDRYELELVKDVILLPVMLDVIQNDIRLMRTLKLRLSALMIKRLSDIQETIVREIPVLNRKLRERGIKVYEQKRTPVRLEARYTCRGYDHSLHMLWSLVRSEVMIRMGRHMNVCLKEGK